MPDYSVSLSPGVWSNSCLLSWWCHPVISSSVTPFSSCPQSFPALGSFPVIQLYSHSTETSALASVLPMNILGWFPLGLTGLILLSKGLSRVFSKKKTSLLQHHNLKTSVLQHSAFSMVQLSYPYMTTGKTIPLNITGKVMSLLFSILARFVIAFIPRNKHLLISWLQLPSAVILEPKKIKS